MLVESHVSSHGKHSGVPAITIAILDTDVDLSDSTLSHANLRKKFVDGLETSSSRRHGTAVTQVIFSQSIGDGKGIAPNCSGIVIPIYTDASTGGLETSQEVLARAIRLAVNSGAHIVNISGGAPSGWDDADTPLVEAVEYALSQKVLIVAAVGNDGCDCLHVPASLPGVLAVGAVDARGEPFPFNNYGWAYRSRGLLAPLHSSSGPMSRIATSYAAPVVSAFAALLCSRQLMGGAQVDPLAARDILLVTSSPCPHETEDACKRFLAGIADFQAADRYILEKLSPISAPRPPEKPAPFEKGDSNQSENRHPYSSENEPYIPEPEQNQSGIRPQFPLCCGTNSPTRETMINPADDEKVALSDADPQTDLLAVPTAALNGRNQYLQPSSEVSPSGCGCGCSNQPGEMVYALGSISFQFENESIREGVAAEVGDVSTEGFLKTLGANLGTEASASVGGKKASEASRQNSRLHYATSAQWVFSIDNTPLYVIRPEGAFAAETYSTLRDFMVDQLEADKIHGNGQSTNLVRSSLAGRIKGQTRLSNGAEIPVVIPELRGLYCWTVNELLLELLGEAPAKGAAAAKREEYENSKTNLSDYMERVYFALRNKGRTSKDRAINYSATNAFQVGEVFKRAYRENLALQNIGAAPSPFGKPGTDCWDVVLQFFNPKNVIGEAKTVFRFTVNVSTVVPVLVGPLRSWKQ